jgi:hypothetical protein
MMVSLLFFIIQALALVLAIALVAMFIYIFRAVLAIQATAINIDKKLSKIIELQKNK